MIKTILLVVPKLDIKIKEFEIELNKKIKNSGVE